jgi:hypothetical protein
MALFPPVTSVDYQLSHDGDNVIQAAVSLPQYEFQHSDNFEFYKPGRHDWTSIFLFGKHYFYLRPELADSLWESVRMKCRYILAAAAGWKGDVDSNDLPLTIPDEKYQEISMIRAPIPPDNYLAHNFLKIPGEKVEIESWIERWQQTGHQLTAWTAKAKENCVDLEDCTWKWPIDPCDTLRSVNDEDDDAYMDLTRKFSFFEALRRRYSEDMNLHTRTRYTTTISNEAERERWLEPKAHALGVRAERQSRKRTRDSSPSDATRNGENSNKAHCSSIHPIIDTEPEDYNKQVIKWQPSFVQLFEEQAALGYPSFIPPSSIDHSTPKPYLNRPINSDQYPLTPMPSRNSSMIFEEEELV